MTNQKVKIIARTVERPVDSDIKDNVSFKPDDMRNEAVILSGKAAGVCYMADDYLSNGIQNEEIALKRAMFNSKSGHHSVYDHAHFTFEIQTSKAMAMVLNSTKLYSTSEKSGRYTSMTPETEIEKKLYDKWFNRISETIKETMPGEYTDKEIEKIALENARYMLSVFTPTVLIFSIPFTRVILMCEWLDRLSNSINEMLQKGLINKDKITNYNYFLRISTEANDLADKFRETLNMEKTAPILKDHKDIGIGFYEKISTYERYQMIKDELLLDFDGTWYEDYSKKFTNVDINHDMYYIDSIYSFACLAQEQRHRTIDYTVVNITENFFYIPEILSDKDNIEWYNDLQYLVHYNGIVPQACKLYVRERGLFDNFYLKCKERMCMRAQEEIRNETKSKALCMYYATINDKYFSMLSPLNRARLHSMINKDQDSKEFGLCNLRCRWKCYKCNEPCKHSHLFYKTPKSLRKSESSDK